MNETQTAFEGRWRRLTNLAANKKGSIHDDAQAKSIGFRGAFVPGSTVATAAMPALFATLGPQWLEGGWYTFSFITPVYEDDEVHEVAERDGDELALQVVNREGRVCSAGRAGLGYKPAWDPAQDGSRGADGVFLNIAIGREVGEAEFTPTAEAVRPMLDSAGDATPWYADASPWGGGVVPPEWLHRVALGMLREGGGEERLEITGVRLPTIWAQHDLAVGEPLPLDKTYRMREWVADKGVSGRTVFINYGFAVEDAGGREVAIGRHKIKWFPEQP
jgi:hypothetical protein